MPESAVTRIVVSAPVFLLAIVLHEVAHGYVAFLCGDDTAKRAGRLTLSPLPHIDPVGAIFFVLSSLYGVGFGWAKPVPISVANLRNPKRDEVFVTLAGPTANLLQAVAWALLFRVVMRSPVGSFTQPLLTLFALGVAINIILLIFNLLPIPPLDGSHVALRILGVDQPGLTARLAPLGFIVLMVLIFTGALDSVFQVLAYPAIEFLLPYRF